MPNILFLLGLLVMLTVSCSSGGSSSGSGGNIMTGSTTYAKEDLAGTWSYSARPQAGGNSCSGTMTFDRDVHLTGITNSCCPQGQILSDSIFWFWNNGYVKGRNDAWCTDTSRITKYSMNFVGSDKRTISGLWDVHASHMDGDSYTRYDITLTSQAPVAPPPVDPGTTSGSQVKKQVKAAGLTSVSPKK
jgi:hypothetical protein